MIRTLLSRIFIFQAFLLWVLSVSSQAVEIAWVRTYNGPHGESDEAFAVAVDSSGNVYVTGSTPGPEEFSKGCATIKYDSGGKELWVITSRHSAQAMAVDESGNVYVTGPEATGKYDTEGNELWVAGRGGDYIAVDVSGNVYVTGAEWDTVTFDDYLTIKYSPWGEELWLKEYNGPASASDKPSAIVVDGSGNCYVTGWSEEKRELDAPCNYLTIKYDRDGNQVWAARFKGPTKSSYDWPADMALDSLGNIYVTGTSYGKGTGKDYATIKYDPDGSPLWIARYDSPTNSSDEATAIALDNSGNVYVTGKSRGLDTGLDYATVRYDMFGSELWVRRYDGPANGHDKPRDIVIDMHGNIYVTGCSQRFARGHHDTDFLTIKYDPKSNPLWVVRYDGPRGGCAEPYAIAVSRSGDVYVAGDGDQNASLRRYSDFVTIKYLQAAGSPAADYKEMEK